MLVDTRINNAIDELKISLQDLFGSDIEFYLFGSFATNKAENDSDIDILVLLSCEVDNELRNKIFDISYDIQLQNDVVFGLIIYSKDFWNTKKAKSMPLYKSIEKESLKV